MSERGWKRAERMLARDVGTERIPVTGERHGADFATAPFAYQLKVRRALPAWLFQWMGGICANATGTGKTGVLVLNRPRRPRRDALVVMRWEDWIAEHGARGVPPDTDDQELLRRDERTSNRRPGCTCSVNQRAQGAEPNSTNGG